MENLVLVIQVNCDGHFEFLICQSMSDVLGFASFLYTNLVLYTSLQVWLQAGALHQ